MPILQLYQFWKKHVTFDSASLQKQQSAKNMLHLIVLAYRNNSLPVDSEPLTMNSVPLRRKFNLKHISLFE